MCLNDFYHFILFVYFNFWLLLQENYRYFLQGDVFELIHYCVQVVRLLCLYFQIDILCNEEILGKDHMLKFIIATRWRVCVSIVVL